MSMPRLKLSVRGLMLLIAAIAMGMGSLGALSRYYACIERAEHYAIQAAAHRQNLVSMGRIIQANIDPVEGDYRVQADVEGLKQAREDVRRLADRCDTLRAEFEKAAWLPFLPLPDERDLSGSQVPVWIR